MWEGEVVGFGKKEEKLRNRRKGDSDGLNSRQEPDGLHVLVCHASSCRGSGVGSPESCQIALIKRASPWNWGGQGRRG